MEFITLEYFNNENMVRCVISTPATYSYLSEDNKQYAPVTHSHMMNLYQNLTDAYILKANK